MAVAALACTGWLVAPALSLDPYVPDPVDFELRDQPASVTTGLARVASIRARDERRIAFRSRVIRTSKRFNVVGLRWKGARSGTLRIRVRLSGKAWSRWRRVPVERDDGPDLSSAEGSRTWTVSGPLWAGEADQVQYRIAASRPVRSIRLHFVNSMGSATRFDRLRSALRRTASGAITTIASLFRADAHAQESTQPEIVSRDEWGGDSCPPRAAPAYGEVKFAFIHHTVTANDYGPDQSAAMVLGICRYHRNSNGWNDIGYQFLVDKYGKIFEGRAGGIDRAVVGAQAQGYNYQSTGISNLGTFSTTGQTDAGLAAMARLLSWKLALHGIDPNSKVTVRSGGGSLNRYPAGAQVTLNAISGHRDGDRTSCPGDGLYAQLPRLRSMVTTDTRAPAVLGLSAERRNIPYGRKARLHGELKSADGAPLPGAGISLQALGASGTRTVAGATTGQTGSFALNLRLVFNRTLQAQFAGNAGLRPTLSPPIAIGVRPRLTAALEGAAATRIGVGRRVFVSGSVRPRKRTALLIVDRRSSNRSYRRIAKQVVKVRFGRIRAVRRFDRPGRYRLRLGVDRDGRNLSARSEPLDIQVGATA